MGGGKHYWTRFLCEEWEMERNPPLPPSPPPKKTRGKEKEKKKVG